MVEQDREQLTTYEWRQQFNSVTSWLHSHRYRHVLRAFTELEEELGSRPIRVIDIGCGVGKAFEMLNPRFRIEYAGIDVHEYHLEVAKQRHGHNDNFRVIHESALDVLPHVPSGSADIIIALETLEHIPEHDVVRLVEQIAVHRPRRFICSVPVEIGPAIWMKNLGSFLMRYVRHREYSWKETFWAGLGQLDRLPPHGVRHKGFDWRWLAQTIRHNLRIDGTHGVPFGVLPAALSTNVLFVSRPRQAADSGDDASASCVESFLSSLTARRSEPEAEAKQTPALRGS